MGRQLRRVPLDFAWPMDKTWAGFLNPHYRKCAACNGRGDTKAGEQLGHLVGLFLLAGEGRNGRRYHPYFAESPLGGETPAPELVEVTSGLAGRRPGLFGMHDACDRWAATKAILKAAGLPEDWPQCKVCNGHGIDPEVFEAHEAWVPVEPPTGEGWQMWETVSEGSPISPVFQAPEALALWLSAHNRGVDDGTTADQWLAMITGGGWAVSLVMDASGVHSGVVGLPHSKETP